MQIACPACHTRYTVPDTAIGAHGRTVRCAKCRHSWYQPGHDEVVEDELADASEQTAAAQPAEAEPAVEPVAAREPVAETVAADGDWHASPPAPRGWADHADAPDYADAQTPDPVATSGDEARPFAASPVDETVEPVIEEEPVAHGAPAFAAPGAEPIDAEYEDLDRPAETSRWKRLLIICGILLLLAAALIYGAVRYFGAPAWLPVGQTTFAPASEALVLDFPADEQDRRELPNGRQLFAASGTITNTGSRTEHVPPVLVVLRDSQERIVYSWEMEPAQTELGPGESVKVSQMVTDVPRSARIVDIGWKPS